MLAIGNVIIDNRVLAAPLAGVTDRACRTIIKQFGCGLVCSEMVSSLGLVYQQEKTRYLADVSQEEAPVAVQIFGSSAEVMAQAAHMAEQMGAAIIDINMGCPTPKVVKKGEGAALMLDVDNARAIVREVVQAVKVPVTVKMRKGWDTDHITCLEMAMAVEKAGAAAITVHPRTRAQMFSGQADWEMIKKVKQQAGIPVIGNGDIWTAADALHMLDKTGCDAVMIGRGAMGNPFIFREAIALIEKGYEIPPAGLEERIAVALKHLELTCLLKGEFQGVREMRKHLSWYTRGMRGAARIRETLNHATTRDEVTTLLRQIK
jgi:nifR3 family TIM-barrel protein